MRRRALLLLAASSACKRAAFSCLDTTGLGAGDMQARALVAYTDLATDPKKTCDHCQQWIAPKSEGCGACKVIKGPVHPSGSCKLFSMR